MIPADDKARVLAVLAEELTVMSQRLTHHRQKADRRARERGARDEGADRLVDYYDHRREKLRGAIRTIEGWT